MTDFESHFLSLPFPKLRDFVAQTGPLDLGDRYVADPWEAMVRTVIGQQVSTAAARSIWAKVLDAKGDEPLFDLFLIHADRLDACGLSKAKRRTLNELITAGAAGELDLATLAQAPFEDRKKALLPFWGIGPWSVEMFSMFHAKDPDIWSPGDLILRRGVAAFADDQDPNDLLAQARPFRTYLALYCWHAAHVNLFD